MVSYYNEIDPYAAQWLRNLIATGHIAAGDVDTRPIQEVRPDDLRKYTQCHFFAGIAGWSYALRLAGWEDDRPVWTGSCPCQPFSSAGKQKGQSDERHLWPHWFRLIRECRPAVIFGEQVAGAIAFGWLDEVFNDLEAENYACAAAVLPACSVGKPHKRDRLWFVADASRTGIRGKQQDLHKTHGRSNGKCLQQPDSASESIVADSRLQRQEGNEKQSNRTEQCSKSDLVYTAITGPPERRSGAMGRSGTQQECEWIECPDGKARPVKSGIRLLAHGVPCRVGRLRAYGNAIVPQVAAEFITAYTDIVEGLDLI